MKSRLGNLGFTLVELIVVITILVILGTIAFLNLGGFQGNARDSLRISNLTNLEKGLDMFKIQSGVYPVPEGSVDITASGVIIGYQGFAKEVIEKVAKTSPGATKDPLDPNMYMTYSTNLDKTKMQLMSFMEDRGAVTAFIPNIVDSAFASSSSNYTNRFPNTSGNGLGILLSSGSLQPVQETGTGVDLMLTNNEYITYFFNNDSVSGTGKTLLAGIVRNNKSLANIIDPSLVGYWDMETITTQGKVKSLIQGVKDGSCVYNNTIIWCQPSSGGLEIVDGVGKNGKAMSFNGSGNYISAGYNPTLAFTNNFTLSIWIQPKDYHTVGYYGLKNQFLEGGTDYLYNYALEATNSGTISFIKRKRALNGNPETIASYAFTGVASMTNKWTLVTLTITPLSSTGNTANLYIDGTFLSSKTVGLMGPDSIDPKASNSIFIGGHGMNSQLWSGNNLGEKLFIGLIDEVRIYNRSLSAEEIATLYNDTK